MFASVTGLPAFQVLPWSSEYTDTAMFVLLVVRTAYCCIKRPLYCPYLSWMPWPEDAKRDFHFVFVTLGDVFGDVARLAPC